MKVTVFCIVVVLGTLAFVSADNWAVLVAGSKTYENYRHQSDVCHAFQVLKKMAFLKIKLLL